jgi:hypothetical protein
MANTTFGPGADATLNPYISTYAGLPSLYQYNQPAPTQGVAHSQYLPLQQLGLPQGQHILNGQVIPGPYQDPQSSQGGQGSVPVGLGLDAGCASIPSAAGANDGRITSLVGPPVEDGNPMVFWDRLIDGIVVGQGYDLMEMPQM